MECSDGWRPTGSTGCWRGLRGDLSRSRLQALIRDGRVTVAGAAVLDPDRRCGRAPRRARAAAAGAGRAAGEAIALGVVYEDDDLIVIDKPAGPRRPSRPPGTSRGTLVNALIAHCGESLSGIGGVKRPGIVHRLDKDTSGLLVVAKNDRAHQGLAAQFADHGRTGPLERAYLALVWGVPERRARHRRGGARPQHPQPREDGGRARRARPLCHHPL